MEQGRAVGVLVSSYPAEEDCLYSNVGRANAVEHVLFLLFLVWVPRAAFGMVLPNLSLSFLLSRSALRDVACITSAWARILLIFKPYVRSAEYLLYCTSCTLDVYIVWFYSLILKTV